MKLNCLERISSFALLANYKEGDFATFKTLKGLRTKLSISEKENKEFEMKVVKLPDGRENYTWGVKGNEGKDLKLTEGEEKLIVDKLFELNESKKLTEEYYALYEKFIEKE